MMTNTEKVETFIDEVFVDFFDSIGSNFRQSFQVGQFFWTHVYFAEEQLQFWRPKDYDETETSASEFCIHASYRDAFNRSRPLVVPQLKVDEEFIVVRAKKRPVILLSPVPGKIDIRGIRRGGKINKNQCVVAPLFSVHDAEGNAKYPIDYVDRVRRMEFPNLFFVPEKPVRGIRHSICHLDCLQTSFPNHLDPLDLCLSSDVLQVLKGQLRLFLTQEYRGDYSEYRECLMNPSC
jgi:hypothetical protein